MSQPGYHRKPIVEVPTPTAAPFDRNPNDFERARVRKLWRRGLSALQIGTLMRLRYGHVERILAEPETRRHLSSDITKEKTGCPTPNPC